MKRRTFVKYLSLSSAVGMLGSGMGLGGPNNERDGEPKGSKESVRGKAFNFEAPNIFISNHNWIAIKTSQYFLSKSSPSKILVLTGRCGSGKTVLTDKIAEEYLLTKGGSLVYQSAEKLMNDCVRALRTTNLYNFRKNLDEAELLIVDGFDYIGRGEFVQEELFHCIKSREREGKLSILVSVQRPNFINGMHENFRSFLESGLIADIANPKYEEKYAFARFQAKKFRVNVLDEHIHELVAQDITFRGIAGAFYRKKMAQQLIDDGLVSDLDKFILDYNGGISPLKLFT